MRLGLVVSRRFGPAVRRNRFKRLVREAFRLHQADWPAGFDLVIRPGPDATDETLARIADSLRYLIPRATSRAARRAAEPPPN